MVEYICDGSRNSKWYHHEGKYVRVYEKRTGIAKKPYTYEEVGAFKPDSDPAVPALQAHLNNILTQQQG